MRKEMKILTIGGIILGLGIIAFLIVLGINDFSIAKAYNIENRTKEVTLEEFSSINMDLIESKVTVSVTEDTNKLVFHETNKVFHKASIKDGVLNIKADHKFMPFGFLVPPMSLKMEVELYITPDRLNKVRIKTISGDINASGINANEINLESISGRLNGNNLASDRLYMKTISGRTNLDSINSNKIVLSSVSGSFNLLNIESLDIDIDSTSGRVSLELVAPMAYDINSTSGKIEVPTNRGNNPCKVNTISGSITITLKLITKRGLNTLFIFSYKNLFDQPIFLL